jgi:hypothetical protein
MNHTIGRSGFFLSSILSSWDWETGTREPEVRAELIINHKDSKKFIAWLEAERQEIERELGQSLIWYNPPNVKACRIILKHKANFLNATEWAEQHKWLRQNLESYSKFLFLALKG